MSDFLTFARGSTLSLAPTGLADLIESTLASVGITENVSVARRFDPELPRFGQT